MDQYNMCPDCGNFFGLEDDGGNGFCVNCAWKHKNHVNPTMNESANSNMWVLSKFANKTFAFSRFLSFGTARKMCI